MQPPLCQGPDPQPRKPRHTIPAGATDCHCHVFEDKRQYPLVAHLSYTPPLAPLSEYLRMIDTLGVERMVQVNASTYGYGNAITLDVIAKLGRKRARGFTPNDGDLLDLLCDWAPDAATLECILVTNPAQLYGFD